MGKTIMVVCLGALVVVTFLYLTKRVEFNKTSRELEVVKLDSREITEGLNSKIARYMDKIESQSQETAVLSGQLQNCQKVKGALEKDTTQLQTYKTKCDSELKTAKNDLVQANEQLQDIEGERDSAVADKGRLEAEMQQLQQENADLVTEKDQCDAINERLQADNDVLNSKSDVKQNCITELSGTKEELSKARSESAALLSQVAALTKEKQSLQGEVTDLTTQLQSLQGSRLIQRSPSIQERSLKSLHFGFPGRNRDPHREPPTLISMEEMRAVLAEGDGEGAPDLIDGGLPGGQDRLEVRTGQRQSPVRYQERTPL
jgi:chromosome segregation ATPase